MVFLSTITFSSILSSVNKEFVSVIEASAKVTGAVNEAEWVLLYQGIARGLGNLDTNITACVKDGNNTIDAFKESFKAFEDRQIIK
uniref:Uncharacterized protein n=1 Tax=Amphimedon queenslandica TaxID=400682 RepID=A0A1X7SEF0_AMPQE